MFDNLCRSWPRESQQCINRLKNKQTSYRVLNTVLIKVLYERCGSWPQQCYGDGYSTGWLRHFIATRQYEFFNFRSAEARSGTPPKKLGRVTLKLRFFPISREPRTSRSHLTRALPLGLRFEAHVCTARQRSKGKWSTARFFLPPKTTIPRLKRNTTF